MKHLPNYESVWGKISTRKGKNFIITFSIKDNLYRLYCLSERRYQYLDKSKDAVTLFQNSKL